MVGSGNKLLYTFRSTYLILIALNSFSNLMIITGGSFKNSRNIFLEIILQSVHFDMCYISKTQVKCFHRNYIVKLSSRYPKIGGANLSIIIIYCFSIFTFINMFTIFSVFYRIKVFTHVTCILCMDVLCILYALFFKFHHHYPFHLV